MSDRIVRGIVLAVIAGGGLGIVTWTQASLTRAADKPPVAGPAPPPGKRPLDNGLRLVANEKLSDLAKRALQSLRELQKRGDPIPADSSTASTWSHRYIEALRHEQVDHSRLSELLEEHSKFMEEYSNLMLHDRNASALAKLDAHYGFDEAFRTSREAFEALRGESR